MKKGFWSWWWARYQIPIALAAIFATLTTITLGIIGLTILIITLNIPILHKITLAIIAITTTAALLIASSYKAYTKDGEW